MNACIEKTAEDALDTGFNLERLWIMFLIVFNIIWYNILRVKEILTVR